VTLCTEQRICFLGRVVSGEMCLSPAGEMVDTVWGNLGRYYPGVSVDAYVVMPNHVHGIIVLSGMETGNGERVGRADRHGGTVPTDGTGGTNPTEGTVGMGGAMSGRRPSLSTVMQRFKSFTTYEYGKGVRSSGWPRYPGRLWQHRFHEHVIRNERELNGMREYIANNPLQWHLDRENPERLQQVRSERG